MHHGVRYRPSPLVRRVGRPSAKARMMSRSSAVVAARAGSAVGPDREGCRVRRLGVRCR